MSHKCLWFTASPTHAESLQNVLRVREFMLPQPKDLPTFFPKSTGNGAITDHISSNFTLPVTTVAGRHAQMLRTAMPKTAIDKNRNPLLAKSKIWLSGKRQVPPPTLYAMSTEERCETAFGDPVAGRTDCGHHPRTLLF
jgi:hypothetical protein